ncbi:hypothetical protein DYB31_011677, partial [Aphanomyces astaci]
MGLFVACIGAIAAITNPSDASFAVWLAASHNQNTAASAGSGLSVLTWMRSAIASWSLLSEEDAASWVRHNMVVFTLVHVPAVERHAVGCFGLWIWCDTSYPLSWLTRRYGPTIVALTQGGTRSGLHVNHAAASSTLPVVAHPAQYVAKARTFVAQCDHTAAADAYLEAAAAATTTIQSLQYRLDAARCLASSVDKHKSMGRVERLFRMASEAGQCLLELADAFNHERPMDDQMADGWLSRQSALYIEAMAVFDAGDVGAAAAAAGMAAAAVYATQAMKMPRDAETRTRWLATASAQYHAVGVRYHPSKLSKQASMLSICCFVDDMERARRAFCSYAESATSFDAPDWLLHGLFEAYEQWNPLVLDAAVAAYDASDFAPMVVWQIDGAEKATCLAFNPWGTLLSVGEKEGLVILWDFSSIPNIIRELGPKTVSSSIPDIKQATSCAWSPDGRILAVACELKAASGSARKGTLLLWEVATSTLIAAVACDSVATHVVFPPLSIQSPPSSGDESQETMSSVLLSCASGDLQTISWRTAARTTDDSPSTLHYIDPSKAPSLHFHTCTIDTVSIFAAVGSGESPAAAPSTATSARNTAPVVMAKFGADVIFVASMKGGIAMLNPHTYAVIGGLSSVVLSSADLYVDATSLLVPSTKGVHEVHLLPHAPWMEEGRAYTAGAAVRAPWIMASKSPDLQFVLGIPQPRGLFVGEK